MSINELLESRIEEFFKLQGHGLEEYKLNLKSLDDAKECFMDDLGFGTAGLRSEMDVGFNRMNEVTVRIAAMGIARYLKEKSVSTVVIGYDHRHNSKLFAQSSAQVYRSYGLKVRLFPKVVPTPFVPSAIQCFKGEGVGLGVMVTASHNPKGDNGYKVYGENGAQIVDSVAKEICGWIRTERHKYEEIKGIGIQESCGESDSKIDLERVSEWYIEKLSEFLNISIRKEDEFVMPKIVYTPLHGVGGDYVDKVFTSIYGNTNILYHVEEQRRPDPDFPTVDFPNPEEGASTLFLAMQTAERLGIHHVFANDPDADRFCVAERDSGNGEWRVFNGNEIAVLLADYIGSRRVAGDDENCGMLASCVSSRFLQGYCSRRGWRFESTSTGFKNLGNRAIQLKNEGTRVLFAYEEAIGFQVGDWNFDKDGISAMMTFYALLCDDNNNNNNNNNISKKSSNLIISTRLHSVYEKEGRWPVQYNGYYICKPASRIKTILKSITYHDEMCVFTNDGSVVVAEFPGSKGVWLMLRSSGTEPKLKYYSEMLGDREISEDERREFEEMMRGIIESMIEPEKNGLTRKLK